MPDLEVPARPASAGEMKGRLLGLTSWGSYLFYLLPVALGLL
jgi:hypothetical protein